MLNYDDPLNKFKKNEQSKKVFLHGLMYGGCVEGKCDNERCGIAKLRSLMPDKLEKIKYVRNLTEDECNELIEIYSECESRIEEEDRRQLEMKRIDYQNMTAVEKLRTKLENEIRDRDKKIKRFASMLLGYSLILDMVKQINERNENFFGKVSEFKELHETNCLISSSKE